jgi:anti-sigma B factor antagonist
MTESLVAAPLDLGPDLTIGQAASAKDRLLSALADGRATLQLDLSSVTEFDSSGVQLLLATRRSLGERGGDLVLSGASPAVRDALALFGLRDTLGCA